MKETIPIDMYKHKWDDNVEVIHITSFCVAKQWSMHTTSKYSWKESYVYNHFGTVFPLLFMETLHDLILHLDKNWDSG